MKKNLLFNYYYSMSFDRRLENEITPPRTKKRRRRICIMNTFKLVNICSEYVFVFRPHHHSAAHVN